MKDQMKNLLKARPSFNTSAQKETLPSCQAPQPGEGFPLTPPSRETLPDPSLFLVTLRPPVCGSPWLGLQTRPPEGTARGSVFISSWGPLGNKHTKTNREATHWTKPFGP